MIRDLNASPKNNSDLIRIGSRPSPLALLQVNEVVDLLQEKGISLQYELIKIPTQGDQDKKTRLTSNVADDFFTNNIDHALLKGKIDAAIHSAKDLPQKLNPKLEVVALTSCLDDTDAWVSPTPFDRLPSKAKVGTSSFLRQDAIRRLRPDLKLVPVRGTIQERIRLIEEGKIDGIIAATCALKRLKLERLIKDIFPWEGAPLQGQLAVVCRRDDQNLKKIFGCLDVRRTYGKVYLVGAGPGDQELITVKAIRILQKADCVFYDFLVDPALLKYAPRAEHIYVGKRKGAHAISQAELSRQIKIKAMSGKSVVRLKGGDPLVFGRGADEISYLITFGITIEVVPGVSSATGIPSSLGIPLTARGISSSVAFISAHGEEENLSPKAAIHIPDVQTIIFFMGLSKLPQIIKALRKKKWEVNTPVAVISRGTRRDEMVLTGTIQTIQKIVKSNFVRPPALILVGKTVDLYRPVRESRNILFLGTHPEGYRSLGHLIHWPMIKISPVILTATQSQKVYNMFRRSSVVLLTSEYAVEYFFKFLERFKDSDMLIKDKDFAVIGAHTAQALLDKGVHPKLIATEETSEGMFRELKKRMVLKNKEMFFPRSSLPNPYLKTALTKVGAKVHQVTIYKNSKSPRRPLPDIEIHAVVFTSPSTVEAFMNDYGRIPPSWEILCKGPASQRALAKYGFSARILTQ